MVTALDWPLPAFHSRVMISPPPLRQSRISFVNYKLGLCTPGSSSLSASTNYVAAPLHRGCYINNFHTPYQRLVGPALEAPKPAHSRMFVVYMAASFSNPQSPLAGWCLSRLGPRKVRVRRLPRLSMACLVQRMRQSFQDQSRLGPPRYRERGTHPSSIFEPLQ